MDSEQETTPGDPLALESQVCFALALASRSVIAAYRPVLAPLHLTHPQYLVMLALWEHGRMNQKTLAGMLGLDPGTLSPIVRRLEQIGYVLRQRDPGDERSVQLSLTEAGRRLRERAEEIPERMMRRLDLSPEDLRQLHRGMTRLIAAARRAPAEES
ncbi:MarR family winged helix-turn-helix transcriptional regulator [Rothia kristinae]|uniref:MarR family winged helix-turn-helix transcriptional regulator n=1 Tax=Rothia kristinae TaxID=37923 RepID=UPI0011A80E15|nr:MarR family transcriptional regulator [Rothia kristinae]MDN5640794.1 MarR family transcriptional regulator [Actinomycetes bacterium]